MASSSSSSALPSKRQKTEAVKAAVASGMPARPMERLTEALSEQACGSIVRRRDVAEALASVNVQTPYGKMRSNFELDSHTIEYINPFALLYETARRGGGAFLRKHLGQQVSRIIVYADGVRAGNVLRPDGRSYESIFWSLQELPPWYRSRVRGGWLIFAFVDHRLGLSLPAVFRKVFEILWSPTPGAWNMETLGVSLGEGAFCRARFGCLLADERCIKAFVSCKGSSGLKPCISCSNCVGRRDAEDLIGTNLCHVSEQDTSRFIPHTATSLAAVADELARLEAAGRMVELAEAEKATGLCFDRDAIMFHGIRSVACFPETIYWDWMHNLLAGGSLGQVGLDTVARAFDGEGISAGRIDTFSRAIRWPSGQDGRVHIGSHGGVKGIGASDMFGLVSVFWFISEMVVPAGRLSVPVAYVKALASLVGMLQCGDSILACLDELARAIQEHNRLFLLLCPEHKNKPEVHYLTHLPSNMARFGCNLSCFPNERKHKEVKQVAHFAQSDSTRTILTRGLYNYFEAVGDPETYVAESLGAHLALPPGISQFVQALGWKADVVHASRSLRCLVGEFRQGDLLQHRGPMNTGSVHLGFAESFLQMDLPEGRATFWVVARAVIASDTGWKGGGGSLEIVPTSSLIAAVPYVVQGVDIVAMTRFVCR